MNVEAAPVARWGPERLGDLVELCAAALPEEHLLAEDLEAACFDDPPRDPDGGRVGPAWTLGVDGPDGRPVGAIGLTLRHHGELTNLHVQVLVVDPPARRRGVARRLLAAAEAAAEEHGAALVTVGAAAPFYLFTGIDSRWTSALCLMEALGYRRAGTELDLGCPTTGGPAAPPAGVLVEPVRTDDDAVALLAFADRCFPEWRAEFARAAAAGTVHVARVDGGVVGAAAHSVNRLGVVGPVGVDPDRQVAGVGTALMGAVLADLATAGVARAEIAWTSTVRFYARCCGASVLRSSLQYHRWR